MSRSRARALLLMMGACVVLALGLTAALVSSAAAHTSGAAAIAGSATFTDPAGDSQAGPDITSITINGDPATGTVTFAVTATGNPLVSPDGLARHVGVGLDTDKNGSTGSLAGSEYALETWIDSTGRGWTVAHWDGSEWQAVSQPSATMSFARAGDVLTWTLNTADLGGASGFAFYVSTITGLTKADSVTGDYAPDSGRWTYDISATAPPTTPTPAPTTSAPARSMTTLYWPVIGKPVMVPARAMAGKPFTVSFRVTRSYDQKPLTSGKMVGDPSVAGMVVSHRESFKSGVARLSFVVPKTAKGKQLKVKVTIKAPSYKGKDGSYFDAATGQTGTLHTAYSGQSATKIVSIPIT